MAKKQKRIKPKEIPTKRQLSRWQRETRIRRIIIIAAAVFLAGVIGYVGYGYYENERKPLHEIAIEVNDTSFNMGYYVQMLDAQTRDMEPTYIPYMTDQVGRYIEDAELMKQGANDLEIVVTTQEIDEEIKENESPNDKVYRDMVRAKLLGKRLQEYFDSQLPDTMEQAHIQVMLVESQEVADEVIAKIESGGNFTALVEESSCDPRIEGDLGWLPKELMPNSLIGKTAFSLEPGGLSIVYDDSASKSLGYWLIKVTEKDKEKGEIYAWAMLLGSKQETQEVKAKLEAGGNFTALAEEYSQDGGELGWLKRGDMGSEAFDKVVFGLPLNAVSEPVKDESIQTMGGHWIVEVLDKGEHELSEELRKGLASNDFAQWFEEQRENSTINNYLDEEKKAWAVERDLKGR